MKFAGRIRCVYYAYFSQPQHERVLFRAIKRARPSCIVEIGLGDLLRATRLIEYAHALLERPVSYTGIDLFEARPDTEDRLSLKNAYRQLQSSGAKVRLLPGDPLNALRATANGLGGTDLLIVSSRVNAESMQQAWSFIPRMLHQDSVVMVEHHRLENEGFEFRPLTSAQVDQAAAAANSRSRRAA